MKRILRITLVLCAGITLASLAAMWFNRNLGVYALGAGIALVGFVVIYRWRFTEEDFVQLTLTEAEVASRRTAFHEHKKRKERVGYSVIAVAIALMGLEAATTFQPIIPFGVSGLVALGTLIWMSADRCPFCAAFSVRADSGPCMSCGHLL